MADLDTARGRVELVRSLASELRALVLPSLGAADGRTHAGGGASGDVTFSIDEWAEALLERWVGEHAADVAFYSEDRGLVTPAGAGSAGWVLVVDPIDGTRPAMAGFEAACVSVALAPLGERTPTMGDVEVGCIVEIKSGASFLARRGHGIEATTPLGPSSTADLARIFWTYGLRGRPARETIEVLAELIDGSSVGGATFELGSACYDITRVLTGQLDAYIEPGPRIVDEVPGMRAAFERVGGGHVLNNSPYDLAAALLCAEEAGVVTSDAHGRSLAERPLLGAGPEFQMSCIVSANARLHAQLIAAVDRGIERLTRLVTDGRWQPRGNALDS